MAKTTYLSDALLNHVLRNVALSSPVTVYAGLISAVTDLEAGTVTEAAYTGYARPAAAFAAPAADAGARRVQNSGLLSFGKRTDAGSTDMIAFGIWDASTAGNLLYCGFLDSVRHFSAVLVDTTGDVFTAPTHGLTADQRVRFEATPDTPTLPAPLAENTLYWVIAAGLTADLFAVSTTQGGASVAITAKGTARVWKQTNITVSLNDTPQIEANALSIFEE